MSTASYRRLIGIARDKGVSAFVGDGANRWQAVHRLDAARLFRLAVEGASAGSRLHGSPMRVCHVVTSQASSGAIWICPVVSISCEAADAHLVFLGALVSVDNPTANAQTQARLGWQPLHPALIPDLEEGHYFT